MNDKKNKLKLKIIKLILILLLTKCGHSFSNPVVNNIFDFRSRNTLQVKIGNSFYELNKSCEKKETIDNLTPAIASVYAICNSPKIKSAIENFNILMARYGQTVALTLPNLSISSINNKRTTSSFFVNGRPELEVTGDSERLHKKSLNLSWTFFSSGAQQASIDSADLNTQAAAFELQEQLDNVLIDFLIAYYEYFYTLELESAYQKNFILSTKSYGIALRRFNGGMISKSEVLIPELSMTRAKVDLLRIEEQKKLKAISLAFLMTVDATEIMKLKIENFSIGINEVPLTDELDINQMIDYRPGYKAIELRLEAAKKRTEQIKREGLVSASLTAALANQDLKNRGFVVQKGTEKALGITLSIPIFEGFGRMYKVQESVSNSENIYYDLINTKNKIHAEILQNKLTLANEIIAMEVIKKYKIIANDSQMAAIQRYEKGLTDSNEIITAQREFVNSMNEYYSAMAKISTLRIKLNRDLQKLNLELAL